MFNYEVDGESAARMLKSTDNINKHTPVIAVTAYEQTFAQSRQFDDIMAKPVSNEMLYKVLAAVSMVSGMQLQTGDQ